MGPAYGAKALGDANKPRRYSRDQLFEIARSGGIYVDITKFTPDALRSGVLSVKNLTQPMYFYPLSNVSVNRIRGHSIGSELPMDDQLVFSSLQAFQPVRQPQSAPTGDLAQRHAGFARFLKEHASPTHQRVTAGGRIVPMQPRQPPPPFSLTINNENHAGVNPASGPFEASQSTKDHGQSIAIQQQAAMLPFINSEDAYTRQASSSGIAVRAINSLASNEVHPLSAPDNVSGTFPRAKENSTTDTSSATSYRLLPQTVVPQNFSENSVFAHTMTQGQGDPNATTWTNFPQPLVYPMALGTPSGLSYESPLSACIQDQSNLSVNQSHEGQHFALQNPEQKFVNGASQGLNPPTDQYGFSIPASGNPSAYVPSTSSNPTYPSSIPIAPNHYVPGVFPQAQVLNSGSQMTLSSPGLAGFGSNMMSYSPNEAQRHRAQMIGNLYEEHERASRKFESMTKHLEGIDHYLAKNEKILSKDIYNERIRERTRYVLRRGEARQRMQNIAKLLHSENMPAVVANPGKLQITASLPSEKHGPSTPLNVQAPPWTPNHLTHSQNSTDNDKTSQSLAIEYYRPSTSMATDRLQTDDEDQLQDLSEYSRGDQRHLPMQMSSITDNASESLHSNQTAFFGKNLPVITVPAPLRILPQSEHQADVSPTQTLDIRARAYEGHPLGLTTPLNNAVLTQTNSNYEKLMDALRLPVGCVTAVNIIGNMSTMVHGQGLTQPSWERMADHERDYWMRKPDVSFFLTNSSNNPKTSKQGDASHERGFETLKGKPAKDIQHKHSSGQYQVGRSPDGGKQGEQLLSLFNKPTGGGDGNQMINNNGFEKSQTQWNGVPASASGAAEKQEAQASKCASSIVTSAVTVQGQVPASEGGIESLRRTTAQPASGGKSSTVRKSPISPRRMRAMNDLRGIPFFRGFRGDYDKEEMEKMKAGGSPF